MNIIRKLTFRHLKANKGRSIVTTLGIIISVAMITAVFVSMASFLDLEGRQSIILDGQGEVTVWSVPKEEVPKLRNDDRIACAGAKMENVADAENMGWQITSNTKDKPVTGDLYIGDSWNLSQMVMCDYDGQLPKNSSEIAVEAEFIEKNALDWKVVDTVTFATGTRYVVEDGQKYTISGSYYHKNEQFEETANPSFTITAILHDNRPTRYFNILRGMSDEEMPDTVTVRISLKEVNHHSLEVIKELANEYHFGTFGSGYTRNSSYLISKGAIDASNTTVMSMLPMIIIMLVLIMVASVMLIYNAFGMSLAERVRYLGMLASVGATKRQKRGSVYFEGFILGIIGIPVGIGAGILGIGITLKIVGDKIIATSMLNGLSQNQNFHMHTVVPGWAIIGIVIVSAITIFISAYIPARKASVSMPIDAIRQTNEIKIRAKRLRSPKWIRFLFGYEGELAYKNMKRNGRKSRVITISIIVSVVLFLCVNYFTSMFTRANEMVILPYQLEVYVDADRKQEMTDALKNMPNVEAVYCVSYQMLNYNVNSDPLNADIFSETHLKNTYKNLFSSSTYVFVKAVDKEMFNEICAKNHIDSNAYYGDTYKGLLVNNISHQDGGSDVFNDSIIGQHYYCYNDGQKECGIEIGALIPWDSSEKIMQTSAIGYVQILVPEEMFDKARAYSASSFYTNLGVETNDHAEVGEAIDTLFQEGDFQTGFCNDIVVSQESMRTVIFVMKVFIYGFIVLISLITIANIINTISTGIALRRKEFAMLRSVGMTPGGFRKMIRLESLLYGIRSLVVALPLSVVINLLMNRSLGSESIPYEFDWMMYLAAVVVVFILISVTMLYSVSKLKKDSVVETLKEEIN